MSAEHTLTAPVRLLIAESSENSAQEFDSMLRDAGIATRMQLIDLPMAGDALTGADLMLCNADLPQLDLLLPQLRLRAPQVPIILVNHRDAAMSTSHGMRLGAADVVSRDDPDELVLVFKRELAHVFQGQRMGEMHRALQEAEQRCQLLLQSSEAAIAYVHEGMHIYANEHYLKLFGFADADALLGLPLMDLMSDTSADALRAELKRFRQTGQAHSLDFSGCSTEGAVLAGRMTLSPAEYEGEHCMQVTVRSAPAGPPVEANGAIAVSAGAVNGFHSGGSGVGLFLEAARDMLEGSDPYRAILVAQIDGFAKLQEQAGLRSAGTISDQVHACLQQALGERPCGRLSAHQFAFSLTGARHTAVQEHAEALRASIEALLLEIDDRTVRCTLSVGGAELDHELQAAGGDVLEGALNGAFSAALRCEAAGGNRVDLLSKEVAREAPDSEAGQILAQVNEAIDGQRFRLLFQPIISLRGDSDEHYEVFLRMLGADSGEIAPDQFLRTAIEHGVAAKIDRWVILQSIKMLSSHRARGHNTRLTINLTANSVADPEFIQWLGVAIKAARLPSDAVIFQITEQDASGLVRQTREFVEGLKAMHCRASLSRFGLIDNPTELLRHIPVDYVKLDGSHIERLMNDPSLKDEITGLIRDLQASGKLTIIPMVESAGVLSALWQAGANYIQGHYLQEPSSEMNFDFSTDD